MWVWRLRHDPPAAGGCGGARGDGCVCGCGDGQVTSLEALTILLAAVGAIEL